MAKPNKQINLTLPDDWYEALENLKTVYGALTVQDVIRAVLAGVLHKEEK